MHRFPRPLALVSLLALIVPLAGCGTFGGGRRTTADTRYVARDVNSLYNAAWQRMQNGN